MAYNFNENLFDLFQIKQSFTIDYNQLEKQYFILQTKFHPDKLISNNSQKIKPVKQAGKQSVQSIQSMKSAEINQAFNILKDDITRAEYLLSLAGITTIESDISKDPNILMESLEKRQRLEQTKDEEGLKIMLETEQELYQEEKSSLAVLFADGLPKNKLQIESAIKSLTRLKFLHKLIQEVKNAIRICAV